MNTEELIKELGDDVILSPTNGRIIVKAIEKEALTKSSGGIYINSGQVYKGKIGRIVRSDTSLFKKDCIVVFSEYCGVSVNWGCGEFLVLSESDILGYFTQKQTS